MEKVNYELHDEAFVAQFGYSLKGLSPEQKEMVDLACQDAAQEIDRGSNFHDSEFDLFCAYIGGCFENNFNL